MTSDTPWRVKGVDARAREAAKAAAKREGMTLGAWLTRRFLEADAPEDRAEDAVARAVAELSGKIAGAEQALDTVSRRLAALERVQAATPFRRAAPILLIALAAAAGAAAATLWVTEMAGGGRGVGEPVASAPTPAPTSDESTGAGAAVLPANDESAPVVDIGSGAAARSSEDGSPASEVARLEAPPPSDEPLAGSPPAEAPAAAPSTPLAGADEDAPQRLAAIAPPTATGPGAGEPDAETFELQLEAAREGLPDAQYNLGVLYAEGQGVTRDYVEAAVWFARAARQGLAKAQYNLAVMYERGMGVATDAEQARAWYTRAAQQDHPRAQHNLGLMYATGAGIETDYAEAAKWFASAADQGLAKAQYNLALLYERGLGIARSERLAHRWFSLAVRFGDAEAASKRDAVGARLSPRERAETEALVAAWTPTPARAAPETLAPAPPQATETGQGLAPSPALVARVQTLLATLGFDPGPTDGMIGSKTREAVSDYQRQLGLAVDGRISPQLLTHLEKVTGGEQ